ncbi:MAG TPA: phosphoribosylglycinamide synthetase C domain-containing protein [Candidatus Saccharimonadales bacterium]|nr:phosphoribosylglycinamide synthetase C domain-containing protein [Candidatus Saccharimonadales bacterium]
MSLPIMPTRVIIVGGGGREHALAWKLANEPGVNRVVVAPGNPGIALEPRVACVPAVHPLDAAAVVALARSEAAELAVIGPEAPLAAGLADELEAAGVPVFGPSSAAARIETSKAFCREVAAAAGVPMARGAAFETAAEAVAFARELSADGQGCVVKLDGLAAGKGVSVCADLEAAESAIRAAFEADGSAGAGVGIGLRTGVGTGAGARADTGTAAVAAAAVDVGGHRRVIVEARLTGPEASVIVLTDGSAVVTLPAARDHKRLSDGDRGPNTGGMGAFSPLPDLPDDQVSDLIERFHRPILAELTRRGTPFRGALYAGLILTPDGPRLLECNARFGDPETQALLPRLGIALGPLLLAAAERRLAAAVRSLGLASMLLPTTRSSSVAIVLAAAGYPGSPRTGDAIDGLDTGAAGALVFHAGTSRDADGTWRTSGGRVLAVVGLGGDMEAASDVADRAAGAISFPGVQRRHDIGRALAASGTRGARS